MLAIFGFFVKSMAKKQLKKLKQIAEEMQVVRDN